MSEQLLTKVNWLEQSQRETHEIWKGKADVDTNEFRFDFLSQFLRESRGEVALTIVRDKQEVDTRWELDESGIETMRHLYARVVGRKGMPAAPALKSAGKWRQLEKLLSRILDGHQMLEVTRIVEVYGRVIAGPPKATSAVLEGLSNSIGHCVSYMRSVVSLSSDGPEYIRQLFASGDVGRIRAGLQLLDEGPLVRSVQSDLVKIWSDSKLPQSIRDTARSYLQYETRRAVEQA